MTAFDNPYIEILVYRYELFHKFLAVPLLSCFLALWFLIELRKSFHLYYMTLEHPIQNVWGCSLGHFDALRFLWTKNLLACKELILSLLLVCLLFNVLKSEVSSLLMSIQFVMITASRKLLHIVINWTHNVSWYTAYKMDL